jgi:hypothetical protein
MLFHRVFLPTKILRQFKLIKMQQTGGLQNNDEAGRRWLMQNTEGWANFLACLKAWLEYGINLRKGAFDFLKR